MLNHPRAGFAGGVFIGLFNGLGNPTGRVRLDAWRAASALFMAASSAAQAW
jgi:hypothetical protein